eukprot:TRINITY_DN54765_c0_g1_i1.p1 TRINITY_DN54765_c0_g1~~TRINITY_DN54765_c0_g1_i1.p1  ORF type:complete len:141 (+),score=33.68 TRINITY_DN54765_c0_g1_i1:3-425(+)
MMRIVTAIFLKQTLQAASDDAEVQLSEHAARNAACAANMKALFEQLNEYGDGVVTYQEFSNIIVRPDMKALMSVIDLDKHEMMDVFVLLDDGDGKITYEEFITGVLRLKGHARALDVVAIQHEIKRLEHKILKRLAEKDL